MDPKYLGSPDVLAPDSDSDPDKSPVFLPRTPPARKEHAGSKSRRNLLPCFPRTAKWGYSDEEMEEELVNPISKRRTDRYTDLARHAVYRDVKFSILRSFVWLARGIYVIKTNLTKATATPTLHMFTQFKLISAKNAQQIY